MSSRISDNPSLLDQRTDTRHEGAENADLNDEIATLRQDNAELRAQLGTVLTSKSWRWTAPLRRKSNITNAYIVPNVDDDALDGHFVLTDSHETRLLMSQLHQENNELKNRLYTLLSSKSWRVTAPLRVAMYLGKGDWQSTRESVRAELAFYQMPPLHLYRNLPLRLYRRLPLRLREKNAVLRRHVVQLYRGIGASPINQAAIQTIVDHRCEFVRNLSGSPAEFSTPTEWPFIDITVVCFNSRKWLEGFAESLAAQDYPLSKIHLCFVDHGSTDGTLSALEAIQAEKGGAFASLKILSQKNRGFGAGHNTGIRAGKSPYCLVTNADLTFEKCALTQVVKAACADDPNVACWELRQKPYEHPKYYDPVTGETNWCAHACVLLRRSAFEAVGGYDENIFMYGEDVELSYRFRRHGFRLRYCPTAVVWHFTYEHENQVKPLQYTGSVFANLYLRLKYGTWSDIAAIPILLANIFRGKEVYAESRRDLLGVARRLIVLLPRALQGRQKSTARFPFYQWDYERTRHGAFVAAGEMTGEQPLVSIITRTYKGRDTYLIQSMLSVMKQTYPYVEHIIVEDGGTTHQELVERFSRGSAVRHSYLGLSKVGRSAAGNAGLAAANGDYVIFLDDDDLLFADHVETLIQFTQSALDPAAVYSLAWEVPTDVGHLAKGYLLERPPILHSAMLQPFDPQILRKYNYIPIQAIMFKRELYLERGGFYEDLDALEDWNLWNRYAVGKQFLYVPKVTSLFRTPADPETAKKRKEILTAAYQPVAERTMQAIRDLESAIIVNEDGPGKRDQAG